ncbi:hypothetical protein F2Q69_00048152 [Brassica cretica]|uniref:Retrotransposon gag domain-containing protein n=1 Tax=Brassica cretica TaxID=69181 RepID=A0A8S9Q3Z3_BRACR|nr:hypothetical protein F2Q69_00048152 [Brassica cretica]
MEAKVENILAQLAALMKEVRSAKAKVDEHDKLLEKLAVEPRRALATKGNTASTDQEQRFKFSSEELTEDKAIGENTVRDEHPYGFSGGSWPNRAVGRKRGNRRKDGGGDWNVRPIGAAPHDSHPNFGDYRNSEGLMEGGYYEAREDRNNNFERRCVKAAKIEFPPFDGTTDAMEWLQKCDDFFADQRIFSDDAKVRQATFVLTGQAYHWNLNLRRLVTHRLGWEEFKRICKSRFGKADAVNPVGELSNLRHTGTVDDLRKEVEYLPPETIFEAMEYARDNEYKIDGDKRARTFGGHMAPPSGHLVQNTWPKMLEKKEHDKEAHQPRKEEAKHALQKQYWKKLTVAEKAEQMIKRMNHSKKKNSWNMWEEKEKLLEAYLELEDKLLVEEESNDMRYGFGTAPVTRSQSAHINLVAEPNDSMEAKVDNILAQLAALMEEVRSAKAKVDEHDKLLEKLAVEPRRALATKGNTASTDQEQRSAVKFSSEELTDDKVMSGFKGKGVTVQNTGVGTSSGKNLQAIGENTVRDEHPYGFSGGPWPNRAVGRERGNRRKDGGGDWNVRPIGVAPHDSHPNFGDYRNSEGLMEGGYYEVCEDRNNNFERRCVKAAKIEFPPFDGTTDAMEWLQKCDEFFADQRIFSDDANVRKATFVLTGQAYHWNLNLRRLADAVNPVGELSNLRHTGTVDEYCSQFEECLSRQTRLSGDQQLWQFCAGLTDSLRKEVEYLRPETIFEAM